MFGVVPRVIWQETYQPDDRNRVLQASRTMLIIDGERKILVDTGMGNWHDGKFVDRFALEQPDFDFDDALKVYDLSRDDITDVVVTHLHFDHAGGLATGKGDEIVPTFDNATIWLQERQWQWAQNPSPKDRGSFMEPYLHIIGNSGNLNLIDGPADVTANVSLLPFEGHSQAMQTVTARTDTGTCWFPSDLIPTALHLRIPYIMAYDNNPVLTAEEKQQMLARVELDKWLIYFYHDPVYECADQSLITELTTR